jgi:hypothetical protein
MLNYPGEAYVRQSVVSMGPVALERVILGTFWSFLNFLDRLLVQPVNTVESLGPGLTTPLAKGGGTQNG